MTAHSSHWLLNYERDNFSADLTAGIITAVLLIPQGMAYAVLAGLPVIVGLYASMLPPVIYALMGTSRTMSVGPVSVAALLVANALASSEGGPDAYLADALMLAALSGVFMIAMAAIRLDVLVNFIGHPVLSGFTTGAAILIILSQLAHLLGVEGTDSASATAFVSHLSGELDSIDWLTLGISLVSVALLIVARGPLITLLQKTGLAPAKATLVSKAAPLSVLAMLGLLVAFLSLDEQGVVIVGNVPEGVPEFSLAFLDVSRVPDLLPSAFLISVIGFVESVAIARILGMRRRQRISSQRELFALGSANLAASVSGGMPVAGGFSRSMVNFEAGAQTQLASIITAVLVGFATAFFTDLFFYLPKATLAAIIVVAVYPLIDWRTALDVYRYDATEGMALLVTLVGVLFMDIESGLVAGITFAIGTFLWRSSRPHVAEVGRIPGTHHYRNIQRHDVETWPHILLLRLDRSLFFANINYVENFISERIAGQSQINHLVLIGSGINGIDQSALESLESLSANLAESGVTLHLAEIKGPVMDRLRRVNIDEKLQPGRVFLSTESAVQYILEARASDPSTRSSGSCPESERNTASDFTQLDKDKSFRDVDSSHIGAHHD